MVQNEITSTTQSFLDIYDITNDMVIMKSGTVSMILTVDALNFGLLAEEEQDAIIYSYAGLLNSLNYPIQISIKSQTKDVTGYLHLLEEQQQQSSSRKRQQQIARYRAFVTNLIQERNVLDKKFYIVIPASAVELGILTTQSVIPGVESTPVADIERSVILEKARNNLEPKRDHLIAQFGRIGLYARPLSTQEIIQLFYVSYNPEAAEGQQLTDSNNYTTPAVQARVQGAFMPDENQASPATPAPAATPTPGSTPTPPPVASTPTATPAMGNTNPAPAMATPAATPAMGTPTPSMDTPSADDVVAAATADTQPEMPAANPTATPAVSADEQAAIDSNLSKMGGATPTTPTTGNGMATPTPDTTPTPVASPSVEPEKEEKPGGQTIDPAHMPPLPEI